MAFASLISLIAAASPTFASLDLCADEYLLLLARRDQIASVSFLAMDEEETSLASSATGLAANDGSIESVVRKKPDVLLTTRPLSRGQEKLAKRLNMKVVTIPFAHSPDAVANNVRAVGKLVDHDARADEWMARFEQSKVQRHKPRQMLWIGSTSTGLGPTNSAWLNLAGIAIEQPKAGLSRIEQVAASSAPLLISNYRQDQYSRNAAWRDHPLIRKRMRGHEMVDGRAFTCGGPLMLDIVEELQSQ